MPIRPPPVRPLRPLAACPLPLSHAGPCWSTRSPSAEPPRCPDVARPAGHLFTRDNPSSGHPSVPDDLVVHVRRRDQDRSSLRHTHGRRKRNSPVPERSPNLLLSPRDISLGLPSAPSESLRRRAPPSLPRAVITGCALCGNHRTGGGYAMRRLMSKGGSILASV